ncbi:MAG: DNA-3-methyladenine glycosylase family protein [Nitrospinota bacterium]
MSGKGVTHVTWRPGVPLDLGATVSRFTVSADEAVNRYDGEVFERVLEVGGGRLHLLRVRSAQPERSGRKSQVEQGLSAEIHPMVRDRRDLTRLRKTLYHILAVDDDLDAFARVARKDPVLRPLIRAFRGLRLARVPTLFEALVTAVTAQQVNLSFAGTVRARLVRAYGKSLAVEGRRYYAFPTPAPLVRAAEKRLLGMKFSGAKARTVVGLARAFADGELDGVERLPTPAAIERLTRIKGIGRWTAETALLRGMGRLDAFPADDLGIRKIVAAYYGGGENVAKVGGDGVRKVAEGWGLFAPYAMTYLFHAKRTGLI